MEKWHKEVFRNTEDKKQYELINYIEVVILIFHTLSLLLSQRGNSLWNKG